MKAPAYFIICLFTVLFYQNSFGQQELKTTANQVINRYFEAIGGIEKPNKSNRISKAVGMLKKHPIFLEKKLLLPNKVYSTLYHNDHLISKKVWEKENLRSWFTKNYPKRN